MKKSVYFCLRSQDDVREFLKLTNEIEGNVSVSSGEYTVNAKSAIGIFTLDLSKPLRLEMEEYKDKYKVLLKPFMM